MKNRFACQTIRTPGGEALAVLPLASFEAMQDALDAAEAKAVRLALAKGEEELLTEDETRAFLEAATPLAFWRKKRGKSQKALAEATGVTQSYIANIEGGKRTGEPALYLRLARALNVRVEDLIGE